MPDQGPISIRHAEPSDHFGIIQRLDDWWGGRQMVDMLPRLFFVHFRPTSFIAEDDGNVVGFLAGFISQTNPETGYVHFIGVDPLRRGQHIGETLYEHFFEAVRKQGCRRVLAVTSPVNRGSIAFHQRIGFKVLPGDGMSDGTPFTIGYDGPGRDCVRFEYEIGISPPGKQSIEGL